MAENDTAPDDKVPFAEHPLYREAMELEGDEAATAAKLRELASLYPDEQALKDLLLRTELRATLVMPKDVPRPHAAPTAALRSVVLVMFAFTVCMMSLVGFVAAYKWLVIPAKESRQQELALDSLRQAGQARLQAGDWSGAREIFGQLLATVPADPTAEAAIRYSEQQEALVRLYGDAVDAQESGNPDLALELLRRIEAEIPGYSDVRQRIESLEDQAALEAAWRQANERIQAEDWTGACDALTQLRSRNPGYRREEVEAQLYQICVRVGRELLARANGSSDTVREAIGYLERVLPLRPMDHSLIEEHWLATGFVLGAEDASRQEWASAVARWESVYEVQEGYQNGALEISLYDAYPRAAQQLIAGAKGTLSPLRRAIAYLDRALERQPDNTEWIEERRLAVEFVAGSEAFAKGNWETAIAHWGRIFPSQPGYQNGILEERLIEACANGPELELDRCLSRPAE